MGNPADEGPTDESGPNAEDSPDPPPYEPDQMIVADEVKEGDDGSGITFDELHDADG